MIYLPDLCLALGLLLSLTVGWRRGPHLLAPLLGLIAVAVAAGVITGQPAGYIRPAGAWIGVAPFAVRFDRRMDNLAWGCALALLLGLGVWLAMGLLAARRADGPHPAWGVAAALGAGLAGLNLLLTDDAIWLGLSWLALGGAGYAVNVLAAADEQAPAAATGRLLLSLGATLAAGAAVTAVALAAGRITAAGYALTDLPWPDLGVGLIGLLMLALLVQLGQVPALGASLHGAAISRGVLVPLPALYLALRLAGNLPAMLPGGLLPAWTTAWGGLALGGALGGLAAALAWGPQPLDRRLALVSAVPWGLVAWGLGLNTTLGRTAAIALAGATGLAQLGLDPRLGRWRAVALSSLGGLPLLAGFGGVWLLAAALGAEGQPGLGLLPLLATVGGAAALWPALAAHPARPASAAGVGAVLAALLLIAGVFPGGTLLTAATLLTGVALPDALAQPDWGLAGLAPLVPASAWPATALAGLLLLGVSVALVLAWRRRQSDASRPAPGAWRMGDDALVPVARALRLDRVLFPVPDTVLAPVLTPGGRIAHALGASLRLAGQALVATEGPYYLLFTVLMLLLALLALSR